ncbi:hypothetical protein [Micromonospora sp. NPDC049679]|uniref:hypothetical protein n=1 Tax=Micromonospora sp. NPDC049679 TaxID=3155920 RepID=UPI0033D2B8FD
MRLLRMMLTALALALLPLLLLPAHPAAAHGGKVNLEVAGDGATGVTVRATYKQDGHPVEDTVLRLVLTATADGGRAVGPIQLNPAAEGHGFYTSGAVLTPGRWQVTVTAPEPNAARTAVTVEARAAQSAPPPVPVQATTGAAGAGWLWWVAGAAVVVALAGTGVLIARRR